MAKRIGEKLIEAGLVSAEAVEQALGHQKITGYKLGDCLVELGLIPEAALLRFLAAEFKVRFVTSEKLAAVRIPPDVLERAPVRMAEKQDFLPIAYDKENEILSVVMAEPQNEGVVKEISIITEMAEIYPYIATRAAIQAGIKKHYYGDPTAFQALQSSAAQGGQGVRKPSDGSYQAGESRVVNLNEISGARSNSGRTASRINPTQLREALGAVRGTVGENDYLETLNILVGLLEMGRKEFRGHSAQVARQAQLIARRIGLQPRDVAQTAIAAYLHDLGKKPDKHLTLPTLAHQPESKAEAKRYARAPIKLFETVHLPGAVNAILAQLYECFDGSGVPQGVKGEDIPAGARIISAVDAYFDMTRNPANAYARVLTKEEAIATMREAAGTLFDPVVVEALDTLQSGDLLKQRLEQDGRQIFVADPDEAVRTDLMDALGKSGLVSQSVLKLDGVIDAVLANEADTIVVGIGYGVGDIVALVQFVRARPESASLPVLLLGNPSDAGSKEKLSQAGVTSFLPLPLNPEEAATTIRAAYLDRMEHGGLGHVVRGNFDELGAAELARILGALRKSGRVTVRSGAQEGFLQLEAGRVVFASFADKKGEAAIQPMLTLKQADFAWDPESLLSDMPNVEKDMDIVTRQLGAA